MHLLTRVTYALRSPAILVAVQFSVRAKGLRAVVKRVVRPLVVAGADAALDCATNAVHTAIPRHLPNTARAANAPHTSAIPTHSPNTAHIADITCHHTSRVNFLNRVGAANAPHTAIPSHSPNTTSSPDKNKRDGRCGQDGFYFFFW